MPTNMRKIVLLSCGKKKCGQRAKAGVMYKGPLFTKSLKYAKKKLNPDKIFILSAKHGLLRLDDEIEPYDKTLNNMKAVEKRQWADKVLQQLRTHTDIDNDHFVFLAGKNYCAFLMPHIKHYRVPMEGLRIGEQMAWLGRESNE